MERRTSVSLQEGDNSYDNRQAKQRATVKWLLSKAYNNKVPENVREPFYKDHENQEHLKPQLVHSFSNAELYCLALANIYTDPNYHNLNHWGILRALNNKGIFPDKRLTETVLIQTNPLKLSAHLSVMEAIMSLYAKEVATPDRVLAAVERFSPNKDESELSVPGDHEQALVLWINEAVAALNLRISQEVGQGDRPRLTEFKSIKDLHELSDGVGLAALVSFYCPEDLPWGQIMVSKVPTVSDCVKNLMLVYNFCVKCLPNQIFHMMPEDVSYMRGSMRSNLVVFLADLFNLLEIHPAKCVKFDRGVAPLTEVQPIASSSPSIGKRHSNLSNEINGDDRPEDSQFVVHRGKSIPTLSSMFHNNTSSGDNVPAGKPSNWEDTRKPFYAGRRSRRNSLSDDSQLTVENFGGSQDNLNFIGRNPDKQPAVHVATKEPVIIQSPRVIAQENRNSTALHTALMESQSDEPLDNSRTYSRSNSISHSHSYSHTPTHSSRGTTQAAVDNASSAGLQQMLFDEPLPPPVPNTPPPPLNNTSDTRRMSTFATLPSSNNTTTWQQQTNSNDQNVTSRNQDEGGVDTCQLMNIRMELEEKRRQIENEKRRAEAVINRQRQKMGKAAFFQAVSKGKGSVNSSSSTSSLKTPDSDPGKETVKSDSEDSSAGGPHRPLSFQDISEVEQKWTENGNHGPSFVEKRKSNNAENLIDQYQHSIAQIQEMQSDIQRLTQQQQNNYQQQQQQRQVVPPPTSHLLQTVQPTVQLHSFATTGASQQPITMNYYHPSQQSPQPSPQQMYTQPVINCDIVHQQMQQQQQWNSLYQPPQQLNYQPSPPPPMVHHMPLMQQQTPPPQHQQMQQASQSMMLNNSYHQHSPHNQNSHPSQSSYFNQQHEQVDRLIRNNDPNHISSNENTERFYLHEPPPGNSHTPSQSNSQRKSWNTAPSSTVNFISSNQESRNVWNNRNDSNVKSNSKPSNTSSNNTATFTSFSNQSNQSLQNGNRNGGAPTPPPRRSSQAPVTHAPIPAPPVDDMEPQSISFIGTEDDEDLSEGLSRMNITSGSRTYRIPSPTRQHVRNSISSHQASLTSSNNSINKTLNEISPNSGSSGKGFYISFDDDVAPKRPKPPLRAKKIPKKDRALTVVLDNNYIHNIENTSSHLNDNGPPSSTPIRSSPPKPNVIHTSPLNNHSPKYNNSINNNINHSNQNNNSNQNHHVGSPPPGALIIDPELEHTDPVTMDEMERKKERIMLQSLQRRQQQEEMKIRKELEAQRRRDEEKKKADDKARKKEEMEQRRAAILEQHRIKKALEKAEMEGDKELLYSLKALQQNNSSSSNTGGPPRLRGKPSTTRQRPKTIHIDNHSTSDMHDGMLTPSRGNKGSSSNLSVYSNVSSTPSNMRRDYYRGSQDCLAETRRTSSASFISDFGDDSRGTSPGRVVGRRGSYKTTSRDPSPSYSDHGRTSSLHRIPLRQRPTKYSSYQNRQPRKSNSLMNLSGSSCDQDSMYSRRDNDSGLGTHSGIGTPSRRAPSPGGHPSSPSGPGSLPLHKITRRYDDTVSESGSDYCGPRLYKQPTTKSNRGIILNAVEYCVFPGAVNRDAKNRVLDEIQRSETKHFLILFRDSRCQFRALYSYSPDCDDGQEVIKLYGTGPKVVTDRMFDQFFKYNSGGKSFTQIHTKHLTVTIDAFTIHNSLWQGKKVNLPNKAGMSLVI